MLLDCPLYLNTRDTLTAQALNIDAVFINFSEEDKLGFILSNKDIAYHASKACNDILTLRRSIIYA